MCPYEPEGCVVWSLVLLVGFPMAEWSQARGQTKYGSTKDAMEDRGRGKGTQPRGSPGPPFGARPRRRARRRAPSGRVCHGARPGTARRSYVAPTPLHPVGPPLAGRTAGVGCAATRVAVEVGDLDELDLGCISMVEADLQHSLDQFAAECEVVGMRISTSKSEAMVLSRKPVDCLLQVGNEPLPQVKEFKYLGVLFASEGTMEREIGLRIAAPL